MTSRFNLRTWWRTGRTTVLVGLLIATWGVILLLHPSSPATAWQPEPTPLFPNTLEVPATSSEIRGVWLTTNDTRTLLDRPQLEQAVTQLSRLNLNTLYPVIWNSGYVLYPSAVAQRNGIQPFVRRGLQGYDPLAELITTAHQQNLLVIPWFEFGFMAPPTSELALAHPDWLTQRRDGSQTSLSAAGEVAWLNPFHPEVQQFIIDLVLEVLTQYDVDGIQFDDHTSLPNDFGYDSYTTKLYKTETKKTPHPDPQNPTWVKWRADKITAFITRLNQAIKAKNSQAIISVSPVSYDYAYKAQLQDWVTWAQKGLIDELILQVYQPDLPNFIERISRPEIQTTLQKIPVGVGILTGLRNRPTAIELVQAKVRAARDRNLGISFFYYETLINGAAESPTQRQAILQSLFPSPVQSRHKLGG